MTHTGEAIVDEAVKESKSGRSRRVLAVALALFLLSFIILGAASWVVYSNTKDSADSGLTLAEEVRAACEDPDRPADLTVCDTAEKVIEEAPSNVVGEAGPPGPTGETGAPGSDGDDAPPPSDSQVNRAVALFCSTGRCNGADGRSATVSQVAVAVRTYCNAQGQCRGPAGADGGDGPAGGTGPEGPQGQQGPGPTDAQVLGAVESFCGARENCRGEQGEQGETGATGVVDVSSNCDAPEGQTIDQVNASYDPNSRTIVLTCTYTEDGGVIDPPEGMTP